MLLAALAAMCLQGYGEEKYKNTVATHGFCEGLPDIERSILRQAILSRMGKYGSANRCRARSRTEIDPLPQPTPNRSLVTFFLKLLLLSLETVHRYAKLK